MRIKVDDVMTKKPDLSEIRSKLKKKRKEVQERSLEKLRNQIDAKQTRVDELKAKEDALNHQIERDRDELSKLEYDLSELDSLKGEFEPDEYEAYKQALAGALSGHRETTEGRDQEMSDLQETIRRTIVDLKNMRDQLNARVAQADINDPKVARRKSSDILTDDCRPEIVSAYQKVSMLLSDVKAMSAPTRGEACVLLYTLKAEAGRLRALQDRSDPRNPAEDVILHRCFGMMSEASKKHMVGRVEALRSNYNTNWIRYVRDAENMVASYKERKRLIDEPPETSSKQEKRPATRPGERAIPKEDLLVAEMASKGIIDKALKGKTIMVVGGSERASVSKWLSESFGMRVRWFESKGEEGNKGDLQSRIAQSLSNGGADFVLLQVGMVSHATRDVTRKAAKNRGLALIQLDDVVKSDIAAALGKVCGMRRNGEEHEGT